MQFLSTLKEYRPTSLNCEFPTNINKSISNTRRGSIFALSLLIQINAMYC